jgi:PAS domain S-box-containing protein
MDRLYQALSITADGAFVIDENQLVVFWNQAAEELVGYSFDEVVGRPCYEVLAGRDERGRSVCRQNCHVFSLTLAAEGVKNYDTCVSTKNDELRWINVSIFAIPASADDPKPLVVHLFRDATQKKQNEQFIYDVMGAAKHLQHAHLLQTDHGVSADGPAPDLTGREGEVLALLAHGLNTRDIAQQLSISPSTARNHIQNILHKLQVHSRVEAVAYAFEHGLVGKEQ